MIFLLNLIKIEIKRVLRFLPQIVVGALALCFIVGIISFSEVLIPSSFAPKDELVELSIQTTFFKS